MITMFICVSFFIIKGNHKLHKELKKLSNGQHQMIYDSDLGYRFKKNNQFTWDAFSKKTIDSNVINTIDSFSRRITYRQNAATKHLIVLGCSYTYGQGLNDRESFPYIISERSHDYQAYNYALPGYGAHQIVSIFDKPIEQEIEQDTGVLIYFFIDHHLNRLIRDLTTIRYNFYTPYYKLDKNNELINYGFYYKYRPLYTRFVLGLATYPRIISAAIKLEQKYRNLNTTENYKLLAKVVAASKTAYLEKFPNGRYYVAIFPTEDNRSKVYFEREGINVLDLSNKIDLGKINGRQQDGYHPNVIGSKAIAELVLGIIDTL